MFDPLVAAVVFNAIDTGADGSGRYFVDTEIIIGDLFRDKSVIKNVLVDDLDALPGDVVDAILKASLNLTSVGGRRVGNKLNYR